MPRRSRARREDPNRCRGCGACCEVHGRVLAAEEADLARWRSQGREDLLRRVREGGGLWVDPDTGEDVDGCPFLERETSGLARCAIHATKPEMCRAYPTVEHGFHCARGVRFEGPRAPGHRARSRTERRSGW